MALNKAIITAKYDDPDGKLGNRWKDEKTEIILIPDVNPTTGRWDTTRGIDIDSGGLDHHRYKWDKTTHKVNLIVGEYQGDTSDKTVMDLAGFNDYKVGNKGDGVFYFRGKEVDITWELTGLEDSPGSGKPDPKDKIRGTADATVAAHAQRENYLASRFAGRSDVVEVYLGKAARDKFKAPEKETKFSDVVAKKTDGSYALGEGKGSDMAGLVKQMRATGARIKEQGGDITEQEVVIEKLTTEQGFDRLAGPDYRSNEKDLLTVSDHKGGWTLVLENGVPIKVIVYP
jgi:hypothetical protein